MPLRSPHLTCVVTGLLLGSTAAAQSMTRLQGPGGRQVYELDDSYVLVNAISGDERLLLCTVANGFVPGDDDGFEHLAWFDRWTGQYSPAVSGIGGAPLDGSALGVDVSGGPAQPRYVLFASHATNLGPVHQNGMTDLFLLDRQTNVVSRVSLTSTGAEPNGSSDYGEVSDDGRFVAFTSEASDMTPNDTDNDVDVFVRDMVAGTTELVSVALSGVGGNNFSHRAEISADGRSVAFVSGASDLVPGDTNQTPDLFLRDLSAGTTQRIVLGPGGVQPNNSVYSFSMNPSAEVIAFDSIATNLVAQPVGPWEVYVLDRRNGSLRLVTVGLNGQLADGTSEEPLISDDGGWVLFSSYATNLVANDSDDQKDSFLAAVSNGAIQMVTRSTSGSPGIPPTGWIDLTSTAVSATGRLTVIRTDLEGLVAGDTNQQGDTFVWDQLSGASPIESYCTSKVNSLGCTPRLTSAGEPHETAPEDAFFVSAHGLRNHRPGLLLWSTSAASLPFGGGTLCVGAPTVRTAGQMTGGTLSLDDCTGSSSFHFSRAYLSQHGLVSGTTAYAQFWGRDPGFAPPNAVTLSDGIRFTVRP